MSLEIHVQPAVGFGIQTRFFRNPGRRLGKKQTPAEELEVMESLSNVETIKEHLLAKKQTPGGRTGITKNLHDVKKVNRVCVCVCVSAETTNKMPETATEMR